MIRPQLMVTLAFTLVAFAAAHASDLSQSYEWKPVRVGAGGWVTGFVSHPLDANVRYCRTDAAGAYRWDAAKQEWFNMLVRNDDGSGVPADVAAAPTGQGVSSVAVDPKDVNVVYMVFPAGAPKGRGAGVELSASCNSRLRTLSMRALESKPLCGTTTRLTSRAPLTVAPLARSFSSVAPTSTTKAALDSVPAAP